GFGLLWAFSGLGLALGSLLAAVWLERYGIMRVYTAAIAAMALGSGLASISPSVWVAIWCVALGGAGNGAANVYNLLFVQRGVADRLRGRAFTVLMSSTFALMGIGMIVAGPLTDRFGARWLYGGAAMIAALAALVASVLTRRVPEHSSEEPEPDVEVVSVVS